MFEFYYSPVPSKTVICVTEAVHMDEHADIIIMYGFICALLFQCQVIETMLSVHWPALIAQK